MPVLSETEINARVMGTMSVSEPETAERMWAMMVVGGYFARYNIMVQLREMMITDRGKVCVVVVRSRERVCDVMGKQQHRAAASGGQTKDPLLILAIEVDLLGDNGFSQQRPPIIISTNKQTNNNHYTRLS